MKNENLEAKDVEGGFFSVVNYFPDGNCLFRAFSLAFHGSERYHKQIR